MEREDERLRLFVAIDLPEDVRESLGRLQTDLRRHDLAGLRWTRPEGVHLTLKFLGEMPATSLDAIEGALARAVRGVPSFRLALGAPGTFGDRRGPRVLWVDVEGELQPLQQLQAAIERELAAAGFAPEERGFSPHLTLARVPQPPRPGLAERVARALAAVAAPRGEFEATELVLMRSSLQTGGAVYSRVAAFPLG
ncbi:MAG: RNA 2',3'-cyclic phosphodiesterase [Dehalococcoidia bacterium]|nr:RNA 2',3'-cyclic phosphodiesterase [Dehalococcoidia bacterium]